VHLELEPVLVSVLGLLQLLEQVGDVGLAILATANHLDDDLGGGVGAVVQVVVLFHGPMPTAPAKLTLRICVCEAADESLGGGGGNMPTARKPLLLPSLFVSMRMRWLKP